MRLREQEYCPEKGIVKFSIEIAAKSLVFGSELCLGSKGSENWSTRDLKISELGQISN